MGENEEKSSKIVHVDYKVNRSDIAIDKDGRVVINNPKLAKAVSDVLKEEPQTKGLLVDAGCKCNAGCPCDADVKCDTDASCGTDKSCDIDVKCGGTA